MSDLPKILDVKTVAETRLFALEEVRLRFANGNERTFERLRGRLAGAVMIAPILNNDTVLLIREYGVGAEEYVLGLPKGTVEENEDLFLAANRELMEEVGYGAKKFTELKRLTSAPGYIKGKGMRLLLAEELYPQQLTGDEPEPIEVVPWKINKIDELLKRDDFCEARSVAAMLLIKDLYSHS